MLKRILVAGLLLLAATDLLAADATVLVIESYHGEYAWDQSYLAGIREGLGKGYKVVPFEMDTKRLPKSLYQKQADLAWQTYLDTKPSLVILGDDNALKFLGPKFLETKTPVVYLGINNNPETYVPSGRNITGILERPLFDFTISTISQLVKPKPKKVLVLFDTGTTSLASVTETFQGKTRQVIHDTQVEMRMISNWELWQDTVKEARALGFDALVIGLYHTLVDKTGHNVSADEVMTWTSANSPLPPFGFWDFSIGANMGIGGFVLSGTEQGQAAAQVAKKILGGAAPQSIAPQVGDKGAYVFSKTQLKKYKITLPPAMAKQTHWVD